MSGFLQALLTTFMTLSMLPSAAPALLRLSSGKFKAFNLAFKALNLASPSALMRPPGHSSVQNLGAICRDPTYSVARAMAAPILHVKDACPASVKGASRDKTDTSEIQEQTGDEEFGSSDSIGSDSSSGLDSPREGQHAGKPLCIPNDPLWCKESASVLMAWTERRCTAACLCASREGQF